MFQLTCYCYCIIIVNQASIDWLLLLLKLLIDFNTLTRPSGAQLSKALVDGLKKMESDFCDYGQFDTIVIVIITIIIMTRTCQAIANCNHCYYYYYDPTLLDNLNLYARSKSNLYQSTHLHYTGVLTTPQLHFMVKCINSNGKYGDATEEGYYKKYTNAFLGLNLTSVCNHFYC